MINIAICDDDRQLTEVIASWLSEIQNTLHVEIVVSIYYSGERFSAATEQCCVFDIILMDIEMGGMNGIAAGEKLRSNDENDIVQLIYISSHEEYHLQLFDVQPSGFIRKPIVQELFRTKITDIIKKVIRKRAQGKNSYLTVLQKGQKLFIPFRNIIYIESNLRTLSLYTKKESIKYYGILSEEEKKLPANSFIRIHQSYIVNFNAIRLLGSRKVVLNNGHEFPVSEKRSTAVRKSYLNFRGDLVE